MNKSRLEQCNLFMKAVDNLLLMIAGAMDSEEVIKKNEFINAISLELWDLNSGDTRRVLLTGEDIDEWIECSLANNEVFIKAFGEQNE